MTILCRNKYQIRFINDTIYEKKFYLFESYLCGYTFVYYGNF